MSIHFIFRSMFTRIKSLEQEVHSLEQAQALKFTLKEENLEISANISRLEKERTTRGKHAATARYFYGINTYSAILLQK